MTPETIKYLSEAEPGEFHKALKEHVLSLADSSRARMSEHYETWKATDNSFRSIPEYKGAGQGKEEKRRDQKAEERGEPTKFVLPIAHSQIDTFISFCYQMFTQRDTFFELEGAGLEDALASKIAEQVLEYDLNSSNFRGPVLMQTLTDAARYSFGAIKTTWVEESMPVEVDQPLGMAGATGLPQATEKVTVRQPCYQGNRIVNISPYRFLPDPRMPIYRFQEGEFCGDEDYLSHAALKNREFDGMVAGLEYVAKFDPLRTENREFPFSPDDTYLISRSVSESPYILTEMQLVLTPSQWVEKYPEAETVLGKDAMPLKFLVWMLNDNRIVRISRMNYAHQHFTYYVSILKPDAENFLGLSLYDIIGQLQSTSDWLINSRITSVRKTLSLDLVVDPSALNADDLANRRPIIRLNRNYQGQDVRRFIFQLARNDTTAPNIADTQFIHQYAKEGTGLTDNLVGQFAQGRRSAREASQVYTNAANRIKTAASSLWHTGFLSLGKDLLSNLREGLSVQRIVKITGVPNIQYGFKEGLMELKQVTKADLAGNYDFRIFDGTLPSERQQQAAAIQEYLTAGFQNPNIFLVTQHNPTLLFDELLELRGVRNVNRFRLTPPQISQMAAFFGLAPNPGTPQPGGGAEGGQAQPAGQQPQPANRGGNTGNAGRG
jgi:hypothetical protein